MLKEEWEGNLIIISSESKYKRNEARRRQQKLICLLAPTASLQ
jgi:RNA polymerase subunit RPABC4/transcription elongation factor Spt4